MTVKYLVQQLKDQQSDFEWYPTTTKILDVINNDLVRYYSRYDHETESYINAPVNILDIGAGDGRALKRLSHGGSMFAIENSLPLINTLSKDIFMIGTNFFESTLIDKEVEVIFSNPPYSVFSTWTKKIITEANAKLIYLILPRRWKKDDGILEAIKKRHGKYKIILSSDFFDAERQARAKIDIVAINLSFKHQRGLKSDPFDLWFDKTFKFNAQKTNFSEFEKDKFESNNLKDRINKQITKQRGLVTVLVELYNQELEHLYENFLSISELDADIMSELDVSVTGLKTALKQRIKGLKNRYWKELFDNYTVITSRLTHSSREKISKKLLAHTSIDFTESNAFAVSTWAIKNANKYYDQQLIELVERMVDKANVIFYRSNEKTYTEQDWRYRQYPDNFQKYGLEYRLVFHRAGGIQTKDSFYSWEQTNGLKNSAHEFLEDVITVANNLGFGIGCESPRTIVNEWLRGRKIDFFDSFDKNLMEVKAYLNGNIHIKFNQLFMKTLNIEFGRLKGWLTTPKQASEELNIPMEETAGMFNINHQLSSGAKTLQIGFSEN